MSGKEAPRRGLEGRVRTRRSDAKANELEIRTASLRLLGTGLNPTMAELATAAGVSRQTLYAHYPSRDALYRDLATRLAEVATTAMSEALPPEPADALRAWVRRAWTLLAEHPALLSPALTAAFTALNSDPTTAHEPVTAGLRRVLEDARGQPSRHDDEMSLDWTIVVVVALGHAAVEQVVHGHMDLQRAGEHFTASVLRLCLPS